MIWLSDVMVKPVQPMPETEGIQGALAYLYTGTKSRLTGVEPDKSVGSESKCGGLAG